MTLLAASVPVCAFLAALWLTGRFLTYALHTRLLDVPNARSSHSVATPRGGGMAMVLTTIAALLAAAGLGLVAWPAVVGMTGGGAIVALVGFTDDHRHVSRRWRLLAHVVAAAWVLWWLNGVPPVRIAGVTLSHGWIGNAGAALALVWLINLTNFMDGIDGLAATEAATVCLGGALLSFAAAGGSELWLPPVVLAAAALGFLRWNWPPAKIFMGDAGSGFLGFMLGALAVHAGWVTLTALWGWGILLGVFVTDATVTLAWRIAQAERFYEAHRTHAYQHAAARRGHKPVTLAVAAINLGWLLPIALLVTRGRVGGAAGLALAYTPLLIAALLMRSGRPEQPV